MKKITRETTESPDGAVITFSLEGVEEQMTVRTRDYASGTEMKKAVLKWAAFHGGGEF